MSADEVKSEFSADGGLPATMLIASVQQSAVVCESTSAGMISSPSLTATTPVNNNNNVNVIMASSTSCSTTCVNNSLSLSVSNNISTSSTNSNNIVASASGTPSELIRIKLSDNQLELASHDDLVRKWRAQDSFIDMLEAQVASNEAELSLLRETEVRLRQQHSELLHREKVLVRRLAAKEQEIQEYAGQLSELKASQAPGAVALRQALLDPAVNLLLQRLRQELHSTRTRLEETQNELSAWKFTPDSNTGKRLMAKCRLLYQENEELGRMISSGRLAKLEGDLALQKSFSEEVKKSQSEMDEFLQDLDEDVEGMQSTIYYLQQELRKSKETAAILEQELISYRTSATRDCNISYDNNSRLSSCPLVNGGSDNSVKTSLSPSVHHENNIEPEERTNGLSKIKDEWGMIHKGDEELSSDSNEHVLKINIEDELCDVKLESHIDESINERTNTDVKVGKGRDHSPKTRSMSDINEDVPLSKKVKIDNSNDDGDDDFGNGGLANGESAASLRN